MFHSCSAYSRCQLSSALFSPLSYLSLSYMCAHHFMSYGRERGLCDAPTLGVTSQTCALSAPRVSSPLAFTVLSICGDSRAAVAAAQSHVEQALSPRLHLLCESASASLSSPCSCCRLVCHEKSGHLLPMQSYIAINGAAASFACHPPFIEQCQFAWR